MFAKAHRPVAFTAELIAPRPQPHGVAVQNMFVGKADRAVGLMGNSRPFAGRFTDGRALIWVGIWYGAAILCEQLDHQIFAWTGEFVSGHSLKHIFAGIAVGAIVLMIRRAVDQAALAHPADSA